MEILIFIMAVVILATGLGWLLNPKRKTNAQRGQEWIDEQVTRIETAKSGEQDHISNLTPELAKEFTTRLTGCAGVDTNYDHGNKMFVWHKNN